MAQSHTLDDVSYAVTASPQDPESIPSLAHTEAADMASVELDRFLELLDSLSPEDWEKPTACTLWNVKAVVAHKAGSASQMASWAEFKRQSSPKVLRPYRKTGFSMLDAGNQLQVDERADASPTELIRELQESGPRSIATRKRLPALLRALRLPLPMIGLAPIGYMTDVILTRDMWMHRLDICRATDRTMYQTPEHDGRIVALVVRDLARKHSAKLGGKSVVYELRGPAGGSWRIGRGVLPAATIRMDALDFNLLASGRITPADARSLSSISGDIEIACTLLDNTTVPY